MADGCDHLLIDEYQDVNGLQVDIVRALRGKRRDVTAVGDDFQAIYGWRAASARAHPRVPRPLPDAQSSRWSATTAPPNPSWTSRTRSRRRPPARFPKQLRSEHTDSARPDLVFCRDEAAQADRGLRPRARGARAGHGAARAGGADPHVARHRPAGARAHRRRIPFVKYGGLRYLEAAHVKDFIALLRLADNPADEISWFRVLQLLEGVGPATARRALDVMCRRGSDGWPGAREHLPARARPRADVLVAALGATRDAGAGARAERLRDALAPLIEARYPDGALRLHDLEQLVAAARESGGELRHFVGELVLDPPQSSGDLAGPPHLDEDYLVLSTVHSAKGLEFQAVHVLALYDGNFPADMAAGSKESIDEERRLLYVAMTRARRQLRLYVPVRYYHRP